MQTHVGRARTRMMSGVTDLDGGLIGSHIGYLETQTTHERGIRVRSAAIG